MPVAVPGADAANQQPPDETEVQLLASGVVSAIAGSEGLTPLQEALVVAMFEAMTDHRVDLGAVERIGPGSFAIALRHRDAAFRERILQLMILGALVLRPPPPEVTARLDAFAVEMSVDDGMLRVAHDFAHGSLGLAALDFQRNGYTREWAVEHRDALHTSAELADAWELCVDEPELAAMWRSLEELPAGTIGRRVSEMYRARGFRSPGAPGSVPPLLAQHDWVHVLADYGTTVESELEVFAFIARANDDHRGFSLLAMVVSLFETGLLDMAANAFDACAGQLAHDGVPVRLADAVRRGAWLREGVDFMEVDWFAIADLPLDEARRRFGVRPKSAAAIEAGSVGPWEPGGLSAFQRGEGETLAVAEGRSYDSFGAAYRP